MLVWWVCEAKMYRQSFSKTTLHNLIHSTQGISKGGRVEELILSSRLAFTSDEGAKVIRS